MEKFLPGATTSVLHWGRRSISKIGLFFSIVVLTLSASSCSSVRYLWQAGMGQLELANRSIPMSQAVQQPSISPRIRKMLSRVDEIKEYGESKKLKRTSNYRDYVALSRPYVVYVVSASQELKFEPKHWSFPIVGSFPYLGWFDETNANQYAQELRTQGWDVDVRGARAYSTLGWFNDPLISSMIPDSTAGYGYLAEVILHESVHATFYIENQSSFNESLANFVGDQLASEYLLEKFGSKSEEYQAWMISQKQSEEWGSRFFEAYRELDQIYSSSQFSNEEKKSKKEKIFTSLRDFTKGKREINNATLIQYRTYESGVPELKKLWAQSGQKWDVFWNKISRLNNQSFKRQQEEDLASVIRPLLD